MVILSVSICNKKGKIILARQYVPMTRLRIEGLLAAFPKLIDADDRTSSKQHTFIETDEVRYIYQPMDTLYLLLITNMQSNILEDLSTLRMIAKLIPEYCGGHDEDTVSENAFNLLYALDEVITPMGYKEPVTYKQIEDYVKMDSAEEKLVEIIEQSKITTQKEIMKKKADEFAKRRAEERKKSGSPSSFGIKGLRAIESLGGISSRFTGHGSQATGHGSSDIAKNAISSDDYMKNNNNNNTIGNVVIEQHNDKKYKKYNMNDDTDSDNDNNNYNNYNKKKKKKKVKARGMVLGGAKNKDKISADAAAWDKKIGADKQLKVLNKPGGLTSNSDNSDNIDNSNLTPIEILITEKLYLKFDRDGAVKKFEIKGDMAVIINDPSATQCILNTNISPNQKINGFNGKPTWKLHPRMDSKLWKKSGVLCLKDKQKKFRVGRSSKTSILHWRISTDDDDNIPISLTFWPEQENNGQCTISAQFDVKDIKLKNVIIIFPCPSNDDPDISTIDIGDYQFSKHNGELQWILNDLDNGSNGSLEYTVDDVELENLYPVSIHFEIENTYSNIQIKNITDIDNQDQYEYITKGTCVAEKYIVE